MRRKGAERPEAGKAVKDLRELLGMSQADFAQSIDMSPVTVARWETSQPPRGDHLRRLREVAEAHATALTKALHEDRSKVADPKFYSRCTAFLRIAIRFSLIHLEETVASAPQQSMVVRRSGEPSYCLLAVRVDGEEAVDAAEALLEVIEASKGKSPSKRAKALRLLASFAQQAEEITGATNKKSEGFSYSISAGKE